ncbi:predicted protein [Histoplasma mississippiense (nom. inval.)]|uniref:predicted protein n=1 Tax=Ajellomyces capsulatus (strain NAm1 / WU24) TaxID=2059318 RepID=UPI000157D355|nr:predicted protein [Histoplasma mississippiense (nom. inval.)]EDN04662.1 predicted protein [Histoplasma mississippiense (nom. inval.)]
MSRNTAVADLNNRSHPQAPEAILVEMSPVTTLGQENGEVGCNSRLKLGGHARVIHLAQSKAFKYLTLPCGGQLSFFDALGEKCRKVQTVGIQSRRWGLDLFTFKKLLSVYSGSFAN